MAIQTRRGNFADLDTSRLVSGEPFITLDKHDGDYYVGVAINPTTHVRLASWANLVDIRQSCQDFADDAQDSANEAKTSEDNALISENNAKASEDNCAEFWQQMKDAIDRVSPSFEIDFATGHIIYNGSFFDMNLNKSNGHLEWRLAV